MVTGDWIPARAGMTDMRFHTSWTRSRPSAIVDGCCAEMCSSQESRVRIMTPGTHPGDAPRSRQPNGCRRRGASPSGFGNRLAFQQRHEPRDTLAQLAAVDDHVDGAFLEQELG